MARGRAGRSRGRARSRGWMAEEREPNDGPGSSSLVVSRQASAASPVATGYRGDDGRGRSATGLSLGGLANKREGEEEGSDRR